MKYKQIERIINLLEDSIYLILYYCIFRITSKVSIKLIKITNSILKLLIEKKCKKESEIK